MHPRTAYAADGAAGGYAEPGGVVGIPGEVEGNEAARRFVGAAAEDIFHCIGAKALEQTAAHEAGGREAAGEVAALNNVPVRVYDIHVEVEQVQTLAGSLQEGIHAVRLHQVVVGEEPDPVFMTEFHAAFPLGDEVAATQVFVETYILQVQPATEGLADAAQVFRGGVVAHIYTEVAVGLGGQGFEGPGQVTAAVGGYDYGQAAVFPVRDHAAQATRGHPALQFALQAAELSAGTAVDFIAQSRMVPGVTALWQQQAGFDSGFLQTRTKQQLVPIREAAEESRPGLVGGDDCGVVVSSEYEIVLAHPAVARPAQGEQMAAYLFHVLPGSPSRSAAGQGLVVEVVAQRMADGGEEFPSLDTVENQRIEVLRDYAHIGVHPDAEVVVREQAVGQEFGIARPFAGVAAGLLRQGTKLPLSVAAAVRAVVVTPVAVRAVAEADEVQPVRRRSRLDKPVVSACYASIYRYLFHLIPSSLT